MDVLNAANQALIVCTASAGSGKTRRLTLEYITMLLQNPSPQYYQTIQAVTFTNKSAAEMQERFIQELAVLAADPAQSGMLADIKALLDPCPTDAELQLRARKALHAILCHYDAFRVKTIDAFSQEVIRSFSRELNLPAGYRIELDQAELLDMAATRLIDRLNNPDTQQPVARDIVKQIGELAQESIDEGGNANIKKQFIKLGNELFREDYKEKAAHQQVSPEAVAKLKEYCQEQVRMLSSARQIAAQTVQDIILLSPDDFNANLTKAIAKVVQDSMVMDSISQIFKVAQLAPGEQTGIVKAKKSIAPQDLDTIKECCQRIVQLIEPLVTAMVVLRNLNTFVLLNELHLQINDLCQELNLNLISDSTEFINRIIDGCDIPFIYDRLGTSLNHHLIDEFQDTSRMQYANFKPLISESLGRGNRSLVVGDVKQSIYRFRNSDSSLLSHTIGHDFEGFTPSKLMDNWRSTREIINFNNALHQSYVVAVDQVFCTENEIDFPSLLSHTYTDVAQELPPGVKSLPGGVVVHRFDPNATPDDGDADATASSRMLKGEKLEVICKDLVRTICDDLADYSRSDICILTRSNSQAVMVAETLMAANIGVVSMEALKIASSAMVRLIIASFYYLSSVREQANPKHQLYMEQLRAALYKVSAEANFEDCVAHLTSLANLSLYEVTESLITYFIAYISLEEQPYVLELLDIVCEAINNENADLQDFLQLWETRYVRNSIAASASPNAVTVMTIHKSKGLAFPVVLIPFTELENSKLSSQYLWVDASKIDPQFDFVVPVIANNGLLQSAYKDTYILEKQKSLLDNLNVFYVACTRARSAMHLWVEQPKAKATGYPPILSHTLDNMAAAAAEPLFDLQAVDYMAVQERFDTLASAPPTPADAPAEEHDTHEICLETMAAGDVHQQISILRQGRHYFQDNAAIQNGRAMHLILQQINTLDDIAIAVADACGQGLITAEQQQELTEHLQKAVEQPTVRSWFDGSGQVLSEQKILSNDFDTSRRPDRIIIYPHEQRVVIVDYKFGKPHPGYQRQVQEYMGLMVKMGYPADKVQGYLWYVHLDEIVSVGL